MDSVGYVHGSLYTYRQLKCRCEECRAVNASEQAKWRAKKPAHYKQYKRNWDRALRIEVLGHYGDSCVCCGEKQLEFLALDHKFGGGTRHRKELALRGSGMWAWVKREGFPDLFQVMCHNCNQSIGYYGSCPHADRDVAADSGVPRDE